MSHFKIVPANEFTHILHIQNTNEKGKDKVIFALITIKVIGKRFANLIYKSAKIRLDKRARELKANILMGIFKSWNGLIISCNEKFITLKVSCPSWTELCGVLGLELCDVHRLELHDGLGFDPHFRGSLNFIYCEFWRCNWFILDLILQSGLQQLCPFDQVRLMLRMRRIFIMGLCASWRGLRRHRKKANHRFAFFHLDKEIGDLLFSSDSWSFFRSHIALSYDVVFACWKSCHWPCSWWKAWAQVDWLRNKFYCISSTHNIIFIILIQYPFQN